MVERFAFIGEQVVGDTVLGRLEEAGLRRVEDVAQADVVFTFFLYTSALEDAYFDGDGLIKCARPETLLIDLSPSTPAFARELAAVAAVNDLRFVEAPIMVVDLFASDPYRSAEGLSCYVAGEDGDVACALELLGKLTGLSVIETGAAGSAQLAKARHTVMQVAQLVSAVESEELGRVTRKSALSVGELSGAVAPPGVGAFRAIDSPDGEIPSVGISIGMLMADVAAAMAAADDVDLILPHLEAAMHLLELMSVIGGVDFGVSALSLIYRSEEEGSAYGLDWARAEGMFDDQLSGAGERGDNGDGGFDVSGGYSGYGSYFEN